MRASPEVAEARSGITEEDERLLPPATSRRGCPCCSEGDLQRELAPRLEPEAIRQRVAVMRQTLRSPGGDVAAPLFAADPLGPAEGLLERASSTLPVDPLTGAFVSRRGDAALVMLTPSRAEIDPGGRPGAAGRPGAGLRGRARESADLPLEFEARGRADLRRAGRGAAARGPHPHGDRARRPGSRPCSCSGSAAASSRWSSWPASAPAWSGPPP